MSLERISDTPRWYVVQTGVRQEERAVNNLNAWQVETFLPKLRQRRFNRSTGIMTQVVAPMFPRYLFARFDASRMLHKVSFTRGVHTVVSFGGRPAAVDDAIIELIQSQIGDDGLVHLYSDLKAGDKVKIRDGSLKDFTGVFNHKFKNTDRVAILLTTISYQGHVVIEREFVEKINPQSPS